ncbi:metallophosphoesterase [Bradyrhizobium erythrophlei]|uniref:Serine/threonine protein phosphatase 1 n=1 Tax=Bradyrhizobium erythrophlei TaxID=1437360 RepID=A0A1M7SQY1_9BRAD|nr:metallophosphoesterase [Bradyrhizobium erythrophlei]SHN60778.1 serine/threonine protein phosphatase 1 [Bradyrhizobium erythrophlei]
MLRFWQSRKTVKPPQLPEGVRIYAFGDIHGRADLLKEMFTVIDRDLAHNPINRPIEVYHGDYIDRGPDSAQTLDLLIERGRNRMAVFLKGNHEAYFLEVLHDATKFEDWRQFGGLQTLMSYGIQPSLKAGAAGQIELIQLLNNALPDEHLQFLCSLQPSFECGDYFFVHAGVRPGVPLNEQQESDLLWIRNDFLDSDADFGKFVVHGHTPVRQPEKRKNRINIDTGAYASGNLTVLRIEGSSMMLASNTD